MTEGEKRELAELAETFAPGEDRPPTLIEALASLTDDGDTAELADGRTLRLKVRPDDTSVMDDDSDFYGALAFVEGRRTHDYVGGHNTRPEGFDGNSEILRGHNFDPVWWQPPKDVPRSSEHFDILRRALVDLLEYGYCGLILEVLTGEDACRRPIVAEVASLWGIEPFPDRAYVAEVVRDLAAELGLTE